MGFFDWLRKPAPETKASAAGVAISAWGVGLPVWTERNYATFAEEAYQRNAIAFRCVKLIASGAAAVPWLLYDRTGNEVETHKLLELLANPAPMTSGSAFFEAVYAYLLIAGNSYMEAVGPDRGPPRELWTLRPDRTKVIAGPAGIPAGYEYEVNGRIIRWQADPMTGDGPICHVREFNPLSDWYGMSRVEAAAYGVDRHNAASAHNKALLDNGARPSGALIFEPVKNGDGFEMAPESAIKAAETELLDRHQGPEKAGRPMVLGGSVKWEEMGISPREMDFGAGKDDAARDICLAFGVPHILVVPGSSTYNNVKEAKLELWEDTILPLIDKVTDSLNMWLAPRFGDGLRLAVDLDEISALEPRRQSKRASVIELLKEGVIDATEAREALQYGPREDGVVGKVDAPVLTSLIALVDQAGIAPLARYMRSVGLADANTTDEQILEAATAYHDENEPTAEEIAAAQLNAPGNGEQDV